MSIFSDLDQAQSMIVVPNSATSLALVSGFIRNVAELSGMNTDDTNMLDLACEEAASNILEHAYLPAEKEHFTVICGRKKGGIEVIIRDRGMPFDPRQLPRYNPDTALENRSASGLGTFLMFSAVDNVKFVNLGTGGKEIHLFKRSGLKVDEELIADRRPLPEPMPDESFNYRLIEPEEAIQVSRCMYRAYGYTYAVGDDIYYPERVEEMNRNGEMLCAVAVTDSGMVAGHCALLGHRKGSGVREIGKAAVLPEYRGRSILKDLTQYLIDYAADSGLSGLIVEAVTNHIFSQKSASRNGFRDCALLLGFVPQSMEFRSIDSSAEEQRGSVIISWRPVMPERQKRKIYIYPPHHEFFRIIIDNLGVNFDFPEASADSDANLDTDLNAGSVSDLDTEACTSRERTSHISTSIVSAANSAEIEIHIWGDDGPERLKKLKKHLLVRKVDVVYLRIPGNNRWAVDVAELAEQLGFIPAGIVPDHSGGDVVIYQYLNNLSMDTGKLELYTDTAKGMATYLSEMINQ